MTVITRPFDVDDPFGDHIEQVGAVVTDDTARHIVESREPVGAEWGIRLVDLPGLRQAFSRGGARPSG